MPEISRFFGIVIRMFAEAGARHRSAHFHAYYQDDEAVFGIDPVGLIVGSLPPKHERLVLAWAEIHRDELMMNWTRLRRGTLPLKIRPLG